MAMMEIQKSGRFGIGVISSALCLSRQLRCKLCFSFVSLMGPLFLSHDQLKGQMVDDRSVMYSTSYSAGIPGMMETFGITNKTLLVLGITTYLFGLALGSIILAPLSEMYGRRPIYLCSMVLFTILVLPCALATNLEAILVTRFFGALAGSAMISNAPGTVGDIVTEEYRAFAFSIWSIGPMNG